MAFTQEPTLSNLKSEIAFQNLLRAEIEAILDNEKNEGKLVEYSVLESFGLDLAVFLKLKDDGYSSKFFELKAFKGHRPGGVGFGNGRGKGVQVDLLLMDADKLLLLNQFTRWVLVDCRKEVGPQRYAIFDNTVAKNVAMGNVQNGKQNNFRVNDLMFNPLNWEALSEELKGFLLS